LKRSRMGKLTHREGANGADLRRISSAILSCPNSLDSWNGLVAFAGLANRDESMNGFPGNQEAERWIAAQLEMIVSRGASSPGPDDSIIGAIADTLPFPKLSTVLVFLSPFHPCFRC